MITVSDNAVKHLQALLSKEGSSADAGLRLFVERGGCAGMQYAMKVASPEVDDHRSSPVEGINVYVAQDSMEFLRDSRIDYSNYLTDAGFKIVNPNAARSCGCGTSFEPAGTPEHEKRPPEMDGSVCGSDAAD